MMEFEPWAQHDGGPAPRRKGYLTIGYHPSGGIVHAGEDISPNWPGWFWRLKRVRVGLFRWATRPVCDDPAYAPIMEYRYLKPPRASVRTAEELITEITNPAPAGSPAGAHPATSLVGQTAGRRVSSPGLFGEGE